MAPQWIPQNIQKRLLLYVLQQLSLFSEIDLPNLDVSLGSNSQITLSDVQLDTGAFQIPGIHIRNGTIDNLKLQLNMSDGVNIEGDGLSVTVSLASKTTNSSLTHSEFLAEKSKFSLAQSTLELANSIIAGEDHNADDKSTDDGTRDIPENHLSSLESGEQTPSTLNAMMTKAVEVALSKLNVKLKNINLRIILEHATIDTFVETASFVTVDGIKNIELSEISVVGVKPHADPGLSAKQETQTKEDEVDDIIDDDSDESDNDNDEIYQSMATSSILERPNDELANSEATSHGDSSIYMSATSHVFESRLNDFSSATKLAFVNSLSIKFSGTSKPEDLKIEIDQIRISATPLPLTLLHIVESLAGLRSDDSFHTRSSNIAQKLKEQREKHQSHTLPNESPQNLFKSVIVNKFEVDFQCALSDSGKFSLEDTFRLVTEGIEIQRKDANVVYGNIEKTYIMDGGEKTGGFVANDTKYDLRFEFNLTTEAFTLLLPKDLELKLTQLNVQTLLNSTSYIPQILESLARRKPSAQRSSRQQKSSTTIQTSRILLVLNLSLSSALKLKIAPISYDTSQNSLSISKIQLSHVNNEVEQQLVNVSNTSLQIHQTEKQVRSYDNTGHEIVIMTEASLSIKKMDVSHSFQDLKLLSESVSSFLDGIEFPVVEAVFKHRKKARISSNIAFQTRQTVKLFCQIGTLSFDISEISPKFGDIQGSCNNIALVVQKDNTIQTHIFTAEITRNFNNGKDFVLEIINPDDTSAPILSARTKNFKEVTATLRNVSLDYYAKWLGLFEDDGPVNKPDETFGVSESSSSLSSSSKFDLKIKLVDCGIGLNPARLSAKAILAISNGNIDLSFSQTIQAKSELRAVTLVLIDDVSNILSHETAKKNRNIKTTWSQGEFLKTKGYSSVGKAETLGIAVSIVQSTNSKSSPGPISKSILLDIALDSLGLELCADSSQCLIQVLNDLKQPVVIAPESKYIIDGVEGINVFQDIEEDAFNENVTIDHTAGPSLINEPLNIVDSYYENGDKGAAYAHGGSSDLLDKDFNELAITENHLGKNPYYTGDIQSQSGSNSETKTESSSEILFNDEHFQHSEIESTNRSNILYPMTVNVIIDKATLKIYDGYDWKYTRKSINNAVAKLEKVVKEEQSTRPPSRKQKAETIISETLFDSIHVGLPLNTEDPSVLTSKINQDINNNDQTIEVGKNNIKKLKLRRSKFHKILVDLDEIQVKFNVVCNQNPENTIRKVISESEDYELLSELDVVVKDFEVTDNVPTSTWNKFVTLLKEINREDGSSMLKLNMKTVRPIASLAATEILLNVDVLPLRLHVDQDTLEVFVRFGEFKDSRFLLVDEFEDIPYIQKFHINAVPIKLDYKPKKVDYSGLRSGRTTEFMNFFILDEAAMVLKEVTLYGVSGFPRLGILLNGLWTPDIKQTQLTGVLAGLAPVRSIVNIGSGFKDLVVVPVQEYKKDGRIYRSLSKGVQQFTRNTTNELLRFGIKLAAGTQTLLENTEEALGGVGSSARLPVEIDTIPEEPEDEEEDEDWNPQSSQLIGRSAPSSQQPLHRSIYQPTLESIADFNEDPYRTTEVPASRRRPVKKIIRQVNEDLEGYDEEDESQRTISLYANQPKNLKEGLLLAYDSLGRNFLVAKDAILNAGSEIKEGGTAHDTTLAVVKATPVALIRPIIGATEAASKALLGMNNQFDHSQEKFIDDKYKQTKR